MQPLQISIHDPRTGTDADEVFARSPVRIGRNALNDLPLYEPSVSQWHAQLAFDHEALWFTDVGSSNGSVIDGARVPPHQAVRVDASTTLEVGPLVLRVQRGASDGSETGVEARHENAVASVGCFQYRGEVAGLDLGREAAWRTVGLADAALIREDQTTESTQAS